MMLPDVIRDNPKDLVGALLEASNRQTKTNRQLSRTIKTLFASLNNSNQGAENFFFEDKFEKFMDSLGKQFDTLGMRLMSGLFEISEKIEDANKNVISLVDDLTKQKEEEKKSKKADHFWEEDKEKSKVKREEAQIGVLEKILKQMGNKSLDFLFDGLSDKIGFNENKPGMGFGGMVETIKDSVLLGLGIKGIGGKGGGLLKGGLALSRKMGVSGLFKGAVRLGSKGIKALTWVAKRFPFLSAIYGVGEGLINIEDITKGQDMTGISGWFRTKQVMISGLISGFASGLTFGISEYLGLDTKKVYSFINPIAEKLGAILTGKISEIWEILDKQTEGWLGQNWKDFKINISKKYDGFMTWYNNVDNTFSGGVKRAFENFKSIFSYEGFKNNLRNIGSPGRFNTASSDTSVNPKMRELSGWAKKVADTRNVELRAKHNVKSGRCAAGVGTAWEKTMGDYLGCNANEIDELMAKKGIPEVVGLSADEIIALGEGFILQYPGINAQGYQHTGITGGDGMDYSNAAISIADLIRQKGIPKVFKIGDDTQQPSMKPIVKMKFGGLNTTSDQDQRNSSLAKAQMDSKSGEAFNMSTPPVTIIQETNNNNINQVPTTWDTSLYNSSFDFYVLKLMGKM